MSAITFSGLATGIDTASMIDQLVNLEGSTSRQMATRKKEYQSQISIVQNLNSKLQALQKNVQGLSTADKFLAYESITSDDDYVSVSATGNATPGSYSVQVDWLAETERRYSKGFDTKDVAGVAGEGMLTIKVGSEDEVNIDIKTTDTLEMIVSKINSSDVKATAGILYDGSKYYLQLSGTETGAENALSVTESGASLDMALDDTDPDVNIVQTAKDAQLQMDGFTISSASNEVTTAIPGVTLKLHEATTSAVNISIAPSSSAITDKIKGFVDAYNAVTSIIRSEFAFTGEAKDDSHLTGDSTLRSIQMQLSQMISGGNDSLPGNYKALSQLGIKTGSDGLLSIDTEKLNAAIAKDVTGVSELFTGTADHTVGGISTKLDTLIKSFIDYSDGILTAKVNGMKRAITGIDRSILTQEEYLSKYEDKLRAQFSAMELMVNSLKSQGNVLSNTNYLW